MVQNVEPIFPKVPRVSWSDAILTANTTKDGTAGTVTLVFTAGADGSFIEKITGMPLGNNIQSVARIFLNNGLTNTTAANNSLTDQIDLPAITGYAENAGAARVALPLNLAIPPNYRLYITIGTTVASGWEFTAWGGDY